MAEYRVEKVSDDATDALTGAAGAPNKPAEDTEQVYFEGNPLLRGELASGILWVVGGLLLIALPIAWGFWQRSRNAADPWWPWWVILAMVILGLVFLLVPAIKAKTVKYRLTNYRINFERGLFSKHIDTMELWHVDDLSFHQSFLSRLLGVGTITILSDDQTTPKLEIFGLPNARSLFNTLQQRVIAIKRQRGVIKMDTGT